MLDKEQRIKEQRTAEAMKKNLMGLGGKFACIACHLGSKIIDETGGLYCETPMFDVRELNTGFEFDYTKIYDGEENGYSREIGCLFDGLSRGIHLEIKYLSDEKSLTVSYKGVMVYREVAGDLECYAPTLEWEGKIEKLYITAKKIADQKRRIEGKEAKEKVARRYNQFFEQLRLRWGL
jgi:hypothetical protein